MRGFLVALTLTTRVQTHLELAARSGTHLEPFLWKAPDADHFDQAHAAHLLALAECDRRGIAPCMIVEEDAVWDTRVNLTSLVADLACQWSVMTLGVVPHEMAGTYRQKCGANAVFVPKFSAGCHAYIARDPAALFLRLAARGLSRQNQHATPCIEYLEGDDLLMSTSVHALQSGKSSREGVDWKFENDHVKPDVCESVHEWWSQTRNWLGCKTGLS